MTETQNQQQTPQYPPPPYYYPMPQHSDDEIDLRELFSVIWKGKWWIIACAIVFGLAGGIYAFLQPNVYQSSVLIAPADNNEAGQMAGLASQFGGLASLAGINLNSGSNKTTLALQVLQSRKFIGDFITRHHLLAELMATKGWDKKTEHLKYDSSLYNSKTKQWLIDDGKSLKPTLLEAIKYFLKKILAVNTDTKTNMTTVSVDYYSPNIAQQWGTWLIADLNEEMRQQDMMNAQNSIHYLNDQLNKTSLAENRTMLYQLIEQQTKTLMLANVRKEYAFKTIDPGIIPEYAYKPNYLIIVIISIIIGLIVGICYILFISNKSD
ncbi:Wzz/FepE/Etk N-terminal domain-containing protein [Celerinatantimonas diazotrophica]|uniref:Subunit length determinant protein n=1 Tax=Celerinatantimonas diazotrophica TaxID=412034 RepID=A0A4R1K5Q6_9GAMM|nr:Wzz/FepE/Etk N-terminal domain-containing protein [Celerinatantimonas diazotrophica]TCK59083.1 subunit length determinant protein [Celerinatantimonas diazotrophica]CAG9297721.1 ECA polysaccharide chain length modulation protein [Celerinatantimonas diazotrophica]